MFSCESCENFNPNEGGLLRGSLGKFEIWYESTHTYEVLENIPVALETF